MLNNRLKAHRLKLKCIREAETKHGRVRIIPTKKENVSLDFYFVSTLKQAVFEVPTRANILLIGCDVHELLAWAMDGERGQERTTIDDHLQGIHSIKGIQLNTNLFLMFSQ